MGYNFHNNNQYDINRFAVNEVYSKEEVGFFNMGADDRFVWQNPERGTPFYIVAGNNSLIDEETFNSVGRYNYTEVDNIKARPFLVKKSDGTMLFMNCISMQANNSTQLDYTYARYGSIRWAYNVQDACAFVDMSSSGTIDFRTIPQATDSNGTIYTYHGGMGLSEGLPWGSKNPTLVRTNMPIFNISDVDNINNYIDNGIIEGSINDEYEPKSYEIIYNVYIDGVKDPNIKVTWESSYIEENNLVDSATINITWHGNNPIFPETETGGFEIIKYSDSTFKSSYSGLDAQTDSGIFDFLNWDNIRLQMQMSFIDVSGEKITDSRAFVEIYNTPHTIDNEQRMYGEYGFDGSNKYNSQIFINPESGGEGGINDDGYEGRQEDSDILTPTEGYSLADTMATIYGMTADRLTALARFLWNDNLFDNIKLLNNSPIENVVSVKLLPLSLSGSNTSVVLGNIDTGVTGLKLSASTIKFNIGSIFISPYYNNFFDFSPYTSVTIFIPFIGFKELDCNAVMGKTITVDFIVDLITGACKSTIKIGGYQLYEFDGNCGIDVPLIASNRASIESGYIQSAISGGVGIVTGNISQGVNSMISGATQQHHYSSSGAFSPSCGAFEDRNCFVIINRPQYQKIRGFGHSHGFMCCLTKTIKNLSGFTQTSDSVDLSSIPCLADEKEKIRAILSSGFYA